MYILQFNINKYDILFVVLGARDNETGVAGMSYTVSNPNAAAGNYLLIQFMANNDTDSKLYTENVVCFFHNCKARLPG
jgi:hypothetical protein